MAKKKRTYNPRLVKRTATYSTGEISELFNVHKRTVQEWYKEGLPKIDDQKPFLVLGANLKEFIKDRRKKRNTACNQEEFFCLKCRKPQKPWGKLIDIRILNEKSALLSGLCIQCEAPINKIISVKTLYKFKELFVTQQRHDQDLIESCPPVLNTDIEEGK